MKKHLRIVKERNVDREHTSDLRGLGDDEILKANEPVPVLITYNIRELGVLDANLKCETKGELHQIQTKVRHENYKVDIISLFYAAAKLMNNHPKIRCKLMATNILQRKMSERLNVTQKEDLEHWDQGIFIDESCKPTLVQCGLLAKNSPSILNALDIERLINATSQSATNLKKVG